MLLKRTGRKAKLAGCKLWTCSTCLMKFNSRKSLVIHLQSHSSKSQSRNKQIKCKVKIESSLQANKKRARSKGSEEGNCSGQQSLEKPMDGITSVNRKRARSKSFEDGKRSGRQSREKPKHVITSVAIKKESADEGNCKREITDVGICKRERTKEGNHFCRHCKKTFSSVSSLGVHLRMHNGETPYICDACGMRFILLASFNNHTKNQVCMQKKSDKNSFVKQNEMNNKSPMLKHACKWCPRRYRYPSDLARHSISHEKKVACKSCWQICNGHISLREHMFKAHGLQLKRVLKPVITKEGNNFCRHCKKTFSSLSSLRVHLRKHNGETPYKCDACGMRFMWLASFNKHTKNHICMLKKSDKKSFVKQSEMNNKSASGLSKHSRSHKKEVTHKNTCNVCKEKFSSPFRLSIHMKTHRKRSKESTCTTTSSDIKPHNCNVCYKIFKSKTELDKHTVKYCYRNGYPCNECGKVFKYRHGLTRHSVHHKDVKPFVCDVCHRVCEGKSELKRHQDTHNNLNHPCDMCQLKFRFRTALVIHKKKHAPQKNMGMEEHGKGNSELPVDKTLGNSENLKFPPGRFNTNTAGNTSFDNSDITGPGNTSLKLASLKAIGNHKQSKTHKGKPGKIMVKENEIVGTTRNKTRKDAGIVFEVLTDEKTKRKSFFCTVCKQNFPSLFILKNHIEEVHKVLFICHACKQIFPSDFYLKRHIGRDHKKALRVCHICKKSFKSYYLLNKHISKNHRPSVNMLKFNRSVHKKADNMNDHCSAGSFSPNLAELGELSTDMQKITDIDDGLGSHDSSNNNIPFMTLDNNNDDFYDDVDDHASINSFSEDLAGSSDTNISIQGKDGAELAPKDILGKTTRARSVSREMVDSPCGSRSKCLQNANDGTVLLKKSHKSLSHVTLKLTDQTANHPQALDENSGRDSCSDRTMYKANDVPKNISKRVCSFNEGIVCFKCGVLFLDTKAYRFHAPCSFILRKSGDEADGVRPVLNIAIQSLDDQDNNSVTNTEVLVVKKGREAAARGVTTNSASDSEGKDNATGGIRTINANDSETNLNNKVVTNKGKDSAARLITRNSISDFATSLNDGEVTNMGKYSAAKIVTRNSESDFETSLNDEVANDEVAANEAGGMTPNSAGDSEASFNEVVTCPKGIHVSYEGVFCCKCAVKFTDIKAYASHEPCSNTKKKVENKTCDVQRVVNKASPNLDNANQSNNNVPNSACLNNNDGTNNVSLVASQGKDTAARGNTASSASLSKPSEKYEGVTCLQCMKYFVDIPAYLKHIPCKNSRSVFNSEKQNRVRNYKKIHQNNNTMDRPVVHGSTENARSNVADSVSNSLSKDSSNYKGLTCLGCGGHFNDFTAYLKHILYNGRKSLCSSTATTPASFFKSAESLKSKKYSSLSPGARKSISDEVVSNNSHLETNITCSECSQNFSIFHSYMKHIPCNRSLLNNEDYRSLDGVNASSDGKLIASPHKRVYLPKKNKSPQTKNLDSSCGKATISNRISNVIGRNTQDDQNVIDAETGGAMKSIILSLNYCEKKEDLVSRVFFPSMVDLKMEGSLNVFIFNQLHMKGDTQGMCNVVDDDLGAKDNLPASSGCLSLICNLCEEKCHSKQDLVLHIMKRHAPKPLCKCCICEEEVLGMIPFIEHNRAHLQKENAAQSSSILHCKSNFDACATQSQEAAMQDLEAAMPVQEAATPVQEACSPQENVNSFERQVSGILSPDKGNQGPLSSSCSKGNQESLSLLCNKGNQESLTSLCNKGNQESSSLLCNKGNQESSSSLCGKGNQESSSLLCNKGNQESSSSLCGKGNQESSSSLCDKGNQESSRSLFDKGNQESSSSLCNKGNQESSNSFCNKGNQESSSSLCDKGNLKSSSSLCGKGNQESSSSMCGEGNQESSSSLCDKGNLESSSSLCGKGNQESSSSLSDKGIQESSRSSCDKGIQKSSRSLCDKGIQESSCSLCDKEHRESSKNYKGISCSKCRINFGNLLLYMQHICNCCEKSISMQAMPSAEKSPVESNSCLNGGLGSLNVEENPNLNKDVFKANSQLNVGEDISSRRTQCNSGNIESMKHRHDDSDVDSQLHDGEDISSSRKPCSSGYNKSIECSQDVSDTDSLLNDGEGISSKRRTCSSGDKESTKCSKDVSDSLLNVEEGISYNRKICSSGDKESTNFEIVHHDLCSPVAEEAPTNPVELSPYLERWLCKGTFGEDSRLESTQEVCPNTGQLGINMKSEDADDISVILVMPKGKRKEMQCVEMPSQIKSLRLSLLSPISLEKEQETPIFSLPELNNKVRNDVTERFFSEAFQTSHDLHSKHINKGSLGKSNASNKKAMGIAFANYFEHKVICKWMEL